VGSTMTISAPAVQSLGGTSYGLESWSDGGAASHTVQVGSSPATYAATYTSADLSLSESAQPPAAVCPGAPVVWTLVAHNAGPTSAVAIRVTVTLPAGSVSKGASGDGWSCSGSPIVCTRAGMGLGDAPEITVSLDAPTSVGPMSLSAAVTASTHDPAAGNNTIAHSAPTDPEACPPQVLQVSPTSSEPWSATAVEIQGENFQAGATVLFGASEGSGTTVVGPLLIDVMAPPLPPATLHEVSVRNADGQSGALPKAYFVDPSDVPQSHPFHLGIEKIFRAGITSGCGGGNYCPDQSITRAEMAIFLLRGVHVDEPSWTPPPATGTMFLDVPAGAFAAAWIEELARTGITSGCGGGRFCPTQTVDRATQAVLLLRARHLGAPFTPPPPTGIFLDVPVTNIYAAWIEELFREGITTGCGGSNYCPDRLNTRGEMAVFVSRTFELP
ncbi:MAG TPA: S-layer homology domain-containing protein, partial [Thermoanaerobaculia bacterium]